MKSQYYEIFFAAVGVLLLSRASIAQQAVTESKWCGGVFCESSIVYNPEDDTVTGYSVTEDLNYTGTQMGTDVYTSDPSRQNWTPNDYYQDWVQAEVDFEWWGVGEFPGAYSVEADHYIGCSSWKTCEHYVDSTTVTTWVPPPDYPWYDITYPPTDGNPKDAYFQVYLYPSYNWPGGVYEAKVAVGDGCADIAQALGLEHIRVTDVDTGGIDLIAGAFKDHVHTPYDWAAQYNTLIQNNWVDAGGHAVLSCGWYVNIIMHYTPYAPVDYEYGSIQNGATASGTLHALRNGVSYPEVIP